MAKLTPDTKMKRALAAAEAKERRRALSSALKGSIIPAPGDSSDRVHFTPLYCPDCGTHGKDDFRSTGGKRPREDENGEKYIERDTQCQRCWHAFVVRYEFPDIKLKENASPEQLEAFEDLQAE